jgi:hypothetical protein
MLCQRQAMPSRSSYSARPAFHSASKNPALDHCMNFWCTALALPKRSLGSAFHWQAGLHLPDETDDLLFGESALSHVRHSPG